MKRISVHSRTVKNLLTPRKAPICLAVPKPKCDGGGLQMLKMSKSVTHMAHLTNN